jgi:hypothetical protein
MSTNPKLHPLTVAQFYCAVGYSLVPIPPDGTKSPRVAWKDYQTRRPSPAEIKAWFASGKNGIALIQGSVSGTEGFPVAELLEFETEETYGRWHRAMVHRGHKDLADALSLRVFSPGGGVHLYYRHDDEPSGNQKLAASATVIPGHKQGKDGFTTLIETRGQGGYVLAPGCPPECHPSGKTYNLAAGASFKNVPTLTAEERATVFSVCRELDERPPDTKKLPKPTHPFIPTSGGEGRPGEDFDERGGADAMACLERHGWTICRDHGDWQELMRPGKTRGAGSASFGKAAPGVLHVFSSNAAPFEMDSNTGPFGIVAALDFGGDFKACARFLASRGFGSPLPARSLDTATRRSERYNQPDTLPPSVPSPDPKSLLILARMTAVLRLCALELVGWPPYELLAKDYSDPEYQRSQEAGERIIRLTCGSEVSVSVELLRRRQVLSLADCIASLESELETDHRIEAWNQLVSLDHWLDMADVYADHWECVHHYVDFFQQRFGRTNKRFGGANNSFLPSDNLLEDK